MADKLSTVQSFLNFVPQRQDASPSERVTLQTFEAIFGKVLWDRTEDNYKSNNEAGLKRVSHVLTMAQTLASLPHNKKLTNQLEVMCDEMFWRYQVTITTFGKDGKENNKYFYLDTRPKEVGGGRLMNLIGPSSCVDGTMGYSWSSVPQRIDNIVLCPALLARWEGFTDFGIDMFRKHTPTYGRMTLGAMMEIWGEGTMIHELSHGNYILGARHVTADIPCPSHPERGSYGWDCVIELGRENPEQSIRNADSFAYFALAMYLDNADWHTGIAEPLPGKGDYVPPRPPAHTPTPTPKSS